MTLSRQKLLNALNAVSVGLTTNTAKAPYGSHILMTPKDGALTIVADCIDIRAEATLDYDTDKNGEPILVSHSKLSALLNRDVENVELLVGGNRLQVKAGSSLTHIPLMDAKVFPEPRPDSNQKAFAILDNAAFSSALAIVCPFAGDGLSHAFNLALSIQDDGDEMLLLACDGKQFARVALPSSGEKFAAVIPAKIIRGLVSTIAANDSLTMTVFENSVRFELDGLTLQLRQCDLVYPENVKLVCERMDKACKHFVTVDRQSLASEFQIAAAQTERDEDGVGFFIADNALTVYAKSKTSAEHSSSIETKVAVALGRRRVNHQNIVAHLRSLDCEKIRLAYEPDWTEPGFKICPEFANGISTYFGFFRNT